MELSEKAPKDVKLENAIISSFNDNGVPKLQVGQIIFDINGEYANANLQDEGTAIFELYEEKVVRYSVLDKEGFKVLKVNFFNDIEFGFELVRSYLERETSDYVNSFKNVDVYKPEDITDHSKMTRYNRRKAAYLCCLHRAGFKIPKDFIVKFEGNNALNNIVQVKGNINPKHGITIDQATEWFKTIWENYNSNEFFDNYKKKKDMNGPMKTSRLF